MLYYRTLFISPIVSIDRVARFLNNDEATCIHVTPPCSDPKISIRFRSMKSVRLSLVSMYLRVEQRRDYMFKIRGLSIKYNISVQGKYPLVLDAVAYSQVLVVSRSIY